MLYVHYKLFYKIRVDNFNFSSENSYPILNRFCTDVSSAVLERGRVVIWASGNLSNPHCKVAECMHPPHPFPSSEQLLDIGVCICYICMEEKH